MDAFRSFPAQADQGQGCASPDCPVSTLDSHTLHQFLQAIGTADNAATEAGSDGRQESPIFVELQNRRRRPKLNLRGRKLRIPR
jgi:hypothetical protein